MQHLPLVWIGRFMSHTHTLTRAMLQCCALQAAALIEAHGLDDTTYLYDLGNTTRLFKAWRGALPRVTPFYAVKCNPEVGCSCCLLLLLLPFAAIGLAAAAVSSSQECGQQPAHRSQGVLCASIHLVALSVAAAAKVVYVVVFMLRCLLACLPACAPFVSACSPGC